MAMKADSDIKRDVEVALRWSPDVDTTDVAVKVTGAVVTLTGFVHSDFEKYQAECAAKYIAGVAGVANAIQVSRPSTEGLDDPEIARAAVAEVRFALPTNADDVKVLVHKGHVTLEGAVDWNFQKERVDGAVRNLRGVMGINSHVRVKPRVAPVPATITTQDRDNAPMQSLTRL
jgi:osmotically-inducible protein OsmY